MFFRVYKFSEKLRIWCFLLNDMSKYVCIYLDLLDGHHKIGYYRISCLQMRTEADKMGYSTRWRFCLFTLRIVKNWVLGFAKSLTRLSVCVCACDAHTHTHTDMHMLYWRRRLLDMKDSYRIFWYNVYIVISSLISVKYHYHVNVIFQILLVYNYKCLSLKSFKVHLELPHLFFFGCSVCLVGISSFCDQRLDLSQSSEGPGICHWATREYCYLILFKT